MNSVSAAIFNANRTEVLLILRRDVPVWVLPGGGIDPGETPEQAVIREVLEETGCHAKIVRQIAEYQPPNRLAKPTAFFECKIISGSLITGPETRDLRFFPLTHLPPLLSPPYRGWIQDALLESGMLIKKKIEGISYWVLLKFLFTHPILVVRFLLTKIGIRINNK